MDPLSDVLALLKPQSYLTTGFDAGGDWAIRFESHIGTIKCYAVTRGGGWLSVDGVGDPIRLAAGDCFVAPSGCSFRLASDLAVTPLPAHDVFSRPPLNGAIVHNGGGGFFLIGARFEIDGDKAQALLSVLPPMIHLHAAEDQAALRWSIDRMRVEMRDHRAGASLAAQHLAQMMLLQALRLYLERQTGGRVGWFYALADTQLSAALGAMHADPAHHWTLGELAARAGMSRSVFAQRFREKVGETPMAYLSRWRMMLAAERLAAGRRPSALIAHAVGYESENAFNTAFKRIMGCSPRRYAGAGLDRADKTTQAPHRSNAGLRLLRHDGLQSDRR